MAALAIRWTNKESKNYLDILPVPFFRSEVRESEVEHKIKRPNGKSYAVKCKLNVKDEIATLTYKQTDNRPNSIWPGVTRITFATAGRTEVRLVEWRDEGDTEFVDTHAVWTIEDDQADDFQSFVIKVDKVDVSARALSIRARPIVRMNGEYISPGDRVFVWVFEDKGGRGIEWYGRVQGLDKSPTGVYEIELCDLSRGSSNFGTSEIDKFQNSRNPQEIGLFKKLREYSLSGIRCIEREEAETLLSLFPADPHSIQGQNEVSRFVRLGDIASRPNQAAFSANLRRVYEGRCALTGCSTAEVLEAAHIRVAEGLDDNDLRNGILLRADLHALFDRGLIALTQDGSGVEVRAELSDPSYSFLRTTRVSRPKSNWPSEANIRHHRLRFGFACS